MKPLTLTEAKARVDEIVSAIREIEEHKAADWDKKFPGVRDLMERHPLSLQSCESEWDRQVHNLQNELQLRTAELLSVLASKLFTIPET